MEAENRFVPGTARRLPRKKADIAPTQCGITVEEMLNSVLKQLTEVRLPVGVVHTDVAQFWRSYLPCLRGHSGTSLASLCTH